MISTERSIVVSEANTYRLTAVDTLGCESTKDVVLNVVPNPVVDLGGDRNICYGDTITFDAGVGFKKYSWSATRDFETEEIGQTFIADTILLHTIQGLGNERKLSVKVVDGNGCTNSDTIVLTFRSRPTFTLSEGGLYCGVEESVAPTFTFSGIAPYSFVYTDGVDKFTENDIEGNTFTPAAPGIGDYVYTMENLDDAYCSADPTSQKAEVRVVALPTVALGEDRTLCYGESFTLNVHNDGATYSWLPLRDGVHAELKESYLVDTAIVNHNFPISNIHEVVATVTSAEGCVVKDTVVVTFKERPTVSITGSATYCGLEQAQGATFNFKGTAPFTFTYTDGDETTDVASLETASLQAQKPTATGVYDYSLISLKDATCTADLQVAKARVIVAEIPTVALGEDKTLCYGDEITLQMDAEEGASYVWSPRRDGVHITTSASYLVDTAIVNNNFPLSNVHEIIATKTTSYGCSASDTMKVTFKERPSATISGTATYCGLDEVQGATINLQGTAPFTLTYTDGVESTNVASLDATTLATTVPSAVGVYNYSILSLKDANCTSDYQSVKAKVVVAEIPTVVLGDDKKVCYGENVVLNAGAEARWYANGNYVSRSASMEADTALIYAYYPNKNEQEIIAVVTNADGCTSSDTMKVTFSERPSATISGGATYCGLDKVQGATINLQGTAPFTLTYTDGVESKTVASLDATTLATTAPSAVGVYNYSIVSLEDANCSSDYQSAKAKVVVAEIPTVSLGEDRSLCYGDEFTLQMEAEEGASYAWSPRRDGVHMTTSASYLVDTAIVNNNFPLSNVHEIVATKTTSDGCSASDTMKVTFKERPTATIAGTATYCGTENVKGATINLQGTAPFTFAYTNGVDTTSVEAQTTAMLETTAPSAVGVYNYAIVSLKDANCSSDGQTSKAKVVVAEIPTVDLGDDKKLCYGESVVLNAGAEAKWYANGNYVSRSASMEADTALIYAYYPNKNEQELVAVVTNADGCIASDTMKVSFSERPSATISGGATYCGLDKVQGATINLQGTAPFTFAYTNGVDTTSVEAQTASMLETTAPSAVGVYNYSIVSLQDANCSSDYQSAKAKVVVAEIPTVSLGDDKKLCYGESVVLNAGAEAKWYANGNYVSRSASMEADTALIYAYYPNKNEQELVAVVTNADGCTASDTMKVTFSERPSATISGGATYCGLDKAQGATINLHGTAPFTFAYTNGVDTTSVEAQTASMLTTTAPTSVGAYNYAIVSLKDANCTSDYQSAKAKVVVAEIPTVALGDDKKLCYGESVVLNAGTEAKWYANGNYVSRSASMEADTALIYAYYPNKNEQELVAVVTNADGCTASDTMKVTFSERPSATISGGATYCGLDKAQGATINLQGIAPFTFAYTNGVDTTSVEVQTAATLETAVPSAAGVYNYSIVSLQDANCSSDRQTAKAKIVVSEVPTVTIGSDTTLCYGESIVLNAGKAASYEWTSNGTVVGKSSTLVVDTALVFNYWPVVYSKQIVATIANENGCTGSDTINVTFRPRPTATVSGSKLYCDNEDVQPASFTFDGVAPFTFTYNDGEQSFTKTIEEKEFVLDLPQEEGIYSYRLTSLSDAECSEASYGLATSITIASMPSVNVGEDQVLCKGEIAYLDAQTEEENSCVWYRQSKKNPISVNPSIFFSETDTVTVVVTSPYGCKAYDTVSITIKKPYAEQLGVVTYSENAKDMVIAWEKTVDVGTIGYIVERETDYTNNWVAVDDTVLFSQPALVVDYNIPANRAYKYRLRTIDECGNSTVSEVHRSMHLSIQKQLDDKPSLNWNAYEPMELVSQYLVLRGTDSTAMDTVDRVPASNMTETWDELESFEGKMYYKVLFVLENEVNENRYRDIYGNTVEGLATKAESGPFSLALSNIAEAENEGEETALDDIATVDVKVWSYGKQITIEEAEGQTIEIVTALGSRIFMGEATSDSFTVTVDMVGVYFVRVADTAFKVIIR